MLRKLHRAVALLGAAVVASQALGLVRDRLLAQTFGAGTELDIYYAAFRVPDFLFATVASLVSATVLIPAIIRYKEEEELRSWFHGLMSSFSFAIVCAAGLAWLLMPFLAGVVAPGFTGEKVSSFILLSRILLLSPILLGLSNLFGSFAQAENRFGLYALSPVLYNLGIIAGIVFLHPIFGLAGLAWGVALGALAHAGVYLPSLLRRHIFQHYRFKLNWIAMQEVALRSLPRTIGLGATQLLMIGLLGLASKLGEGSIAILQFSYNLQSVPLALVGMSYSVAVFPTLAKLWGTPEFRAHTQGVIKVMLVLSLPVASIMFFGADWIVHLVLGAGRFSSVDATITAQSLRIFSFSLPFQGLTLLLLRAFYAAERARAAVAVSVLGVLVAIICAYTFAFFWPTILVLPAAYSLGAILTGTALLILFLRTQH